MVAPSVAVVPIIALLSLGSLGLPLGIPPQPEDPLMSKVAPEECLFYTTWSGMATPNPKSTNQTEQLLAEPEIKYLLAMLEQKLMGAIREGTAGDPDRQAAAKDASKWGKRLLMSPTAIFISKVQIAEGQAPDIRGGVLVKIGNDVGELKAAIEKYQATFLQGEAAPQKATISGAACWRIKLPPVPTITWGVRGTYLIIGVGDGEVEGMLNRATTAPPQWLTGIRSRLEVSRQSTMTYVNVAALMKPIVQMGGKEAATAIEALGLKNVNALASVSGLDHEGIITRMLVGLTGEPQGLLGAVVGGQLTATDLAAIPDDASIAVAAKLDPDKLFATLLTMADKIQPGMREEILGDVGNMEQELNITLRQDLLVPLGDTWCIYNSPSEGGLVFTGLTAVIRVDDAAKLRATQAKLLKVAAGALQEAGGRGPRIEHFRFAGQEVYMLNVRETEFPLAPSWCLTENSLIVAPYPQNIKAYLIRGADYKSLATSPAVSGFLQAPPAPSILTYIDTKSLFELIYPIIPAAGQAASAQLARQGIDFDISILPSARSITKHLRPDVMAVRRIDAGIEITSRRTNPILSVGTAAPVAVALLLPAVQAAREAARRANSLNNLKMMGLGMMNHDSALRRLPAAYTVDKNGKPLLSWRVRILPYMVNKPLYDMFHLDEPWDSPHNKQLIEMMPREYASPGIEGRPGMTHYLGICGPDTAFPPGKGIGLDAITDGTSSTVMVVESPKAVPWTKPEDLTFDPRNPAAGVFGLRPGVCNVLFCDGSVNTLPQGIDPEMLRRLLMRNDGKPTGYRYDVPAPKSQRTSPFAKPATKKRAAPRPAKPVPVNPFE